MLGDDPVRAAKAHRFLALESDEPWFSSVLDPRGMAEELARIVKERFDLILVEGTPLTKFLPALPWGVPRVLDLFDVHTLMAQRAAEEGTDAEPEALAREVERAMAWETSVLRSFNACLAVSEQEASFVREVLHGPDVHLVPNGVDTKYFTAGAGRPQSGAVLFTGRMSYEPNADAAVYFAQTILPLLKKQAPHAVFHVVGTNPPARLTDLAAEDVVVYGRVDDVRPHHVNAEVVVVPVRKGGGTRLKVLEAAASGKAIVSTRLGAEGLDLVAGRDLIVADDSQDFANAVAGLLQDPGRRAELGAHARAAACRFDWISIGERFRKLIEKVA